MGMDVGGFDTGEGQVPFPGTSRPQADGVTPGDSLSPEAWTGYRQLNEAELDQLTARIVEQVKRRAPFISVSDFVNRRLFASESPGSTAPSIESQSDGDLLSYGGAIEVAIRQSALNAGMEDFGMSSANDYVNPAFNAPRIDTISTPTERFANAPAHLTQGKVLEKIGAHLTARSDTYRIRAYGEAGTPDGDGMARAWCEAVVQRKADYLDAAADEPTKPAAELVSTINRMHGRRFAMKSFRWLSADEL
ncbi:MAG: hypothetical protein ACO3SO_10285 [Luteolibacter sp.]